MARRGFSFATCDHVSVLSMYSGVEGERISEGETREDNWERRSAVEDVLEVLVDDMMPECYINIKHRDASS